MFDLTDANSDSEIDAYDNHVYASLQLVEIRIINSKTSSKERDNLCIEWIDSSGYHYGIIQKIVIAGANASELVKYYIHCKHDQIDKLLCLYTRLYNSYLLLFGKANLRLVIIYS